MHTIEATFELECDVFSGLPHMYWAVYIQTLETTDIRDGAHPFSCDLLDSVTYWCLAQNIWTPETTVWGPMTC